MKRIEKNIINDINYYGNIASKNIMRNIKISNIIFFLTILFETIVYIFLMFTVVRASGIVIFTLLYIIIALDISISHRKYLDKVIDEIITNCINPEAYIDVNLYNANKKICGEKMFNNSLHNIAFGYIQIGEFNKAQKIIKYLDTRKKDLILQSNILKNKIEIAFLEKDLKEFKKHVENLKKITKFLPKKNKKLIRLEIKLREDILNQDTEEVYNNCDLLEKNKGLLYKIQSSYFKGIIKEKNSDEDYINYYKYVAENGNNLFIANKVRNEFNIPKSEKSYRMKSHILYKSIQIVILLILLFILNFLIMYAIYLFNK